MNPTISQAPNQGPKQDFHARLHRWYAQAGRRDLPWRNTADAYAIYVSEVMLQQTQVTTVLERYYFPFLQRFPTLSALAAASQKSVLSAWQGLGYYNRAINLHKAAKVCRDVMPRSVDDLMSLPGIGRNTAHAVAAFAYHHPVAVMEANVKRVLSRIFALAQPSPEELWEKADDLLDRQNPFDYNQAMMDIGALVCTRRAPRCGECPAQTICRGKTSPEAYPAEKAKKAPPVRQKRIVVLRNAAGKYFAVARQTRFLHGLYHFTEFDLSSPRKRESQPNIPASAGMTRLGHIRQQYSHFTLEADVYLAPGKGSGKDWHSLPQLQKLPMSAAEQKILVILSEAKDL